MAFEIPKSFTSVKDANEWLSKKGFSTNNYIDANTKISQNDVIKYDGNTTITTMSRMQEGDLLRFSKPKAELKSSKSGNHLNLKFLREQSEPFFNNRLNLLGNIKVPENLDGLPFVTSSVDQRASVPLRDSSENTSMSTVDEARQDVLPLRSKGPIPSLHSDISTSGLTESQRAFAKDHASDIALLGDILSKLNGDLIPDHFSEVSHGKPPFSFIENLIHVSSNGKRFTVENSSVKDNRFSIKRENSAPKRPNYDNILGGWHKSAPLDEPDELRNSHGECSVGIVFKDHGEVILTGMHEDAMKSHSFYISKPLDSFPPELLSQIDTFRKGILDKIQDSKDFDFLE